MYKRQVQSSINAAGDSLILVPNLNWNGTTEVMVSLFDTPGGSDNSTFTLTVNPVDDAPTQDGYIADVSFNEDFTTPWSVDLSTIFSDVDNELTYSAELLDPSVAEVQVTDGIVDLYAIPDGNGETDMVVRASGTSQEPSGLVTDLDEPDYSLSFDGNSHVLIPADLLENDDKSKTIQELDREKLEQKFSKVSNEILN